jgi:hypothetical protein
LQYIREYGFETFDGLIDESYDTVSNSRERLLCIIKEMQRIKNLSTEDRQTLYQKLNQISQRNKQRFFSANFQQQVIQELQTNVGQAMITMNQHHTGREFLECVKLFESIPEYHDWKVNTDFRSTQDHQKVLDELNKCTK